MVEKAIVEALSGIERKALEALGSSFMVFEEIAEKASLPIDSVRRAIAWLAEKGFVDLLDEKVKKTVLTEKGLEYLHKGLPEEKFLSEIEKLGTATFEELMQKTGLSKEEFNFALGLNKKKNFVSVLPGEKPRIHFTGISKEVKHESLKKLLEKIKDGEEVQEENLSLLKERRLAREIEKVIPKARINSSGEEALQMLSSVKTRAYDIRGKVPDFFLGKKHPYVQFLLGIRRNLTELGFIEMDSPLIVQEFYHFDALFQPQNHPARQWSDTYQLKQPTQGDLPSKEIVERVKAAHENGWKTGSKGWGYKWSEEIAKRLMPCGHCTAHSARQLVKGVKVPSKYFAIARCCRPDVIDAKHLVEFNQMEGIIIDETMNFRKLLGMLKQFAIEFAGAEKIRFVPSYFPFTEPSCELHAKHSELGWIELGGSGIFRPELTLPLGVKQPVLAWGLGIDRLAMLKLGINDIRHLFSDDLNFLRHSRMVI